MTTVTGVTHHSYSIHAICVYKQPTSNKMSTTDANRYSSKNIYIHQKGQ